jgi:hypothetical protein
MITRSGMGDRRQYRRFEPSGALCATLGLSCPVRLREVAPDHALVEGTLASDLKWLRFARLVFNNSGDGIDVVVRFLRPTTTSPQRMRYLIELDLVTVSTANLVDLRRILRNSQLRVLPS